MAESGFQRSQGKMILWMRERSLREANRHGLQSCGEHEMQWWQWAFFRPEADQALCWALTGLLWVASYWHHDYWHFMNESATAPRGDWLEQGHTARDPGSWRPDLSLIAFPALLVTHASYCLPAGHQHGRPGSSLVDAVTELLEGDW